MALKGLLGAIGVDTPLKMAIGALVAVAGELGSRAKSDQKNNKGDKLIGKKTKRPEKSITKGVLNHSEF